MADTQSTHDKRADTFAHVAGLAMAALRAWHWADGWHLPGEVLHQAVLESAAGTSQYGEGPRPSLVMVPSRPQRRRRSAAESVISEAHEIPVRGGPEAVV